MNHMLNNKKHHEMEEEHRRPDFSSELNPNCSMVDPLGPSSALGPETGVALAWIKTSCQYGVNGKQQEVSQWTGWLENYSNNNQQ